MRKLLILTAYDRPAYLSRTLDSWSEVEFGDWDVMLRLEPSIFLNEQSDYFARFLGKVQLQGLATCHVNPERYGVLLHPYVAFEDAFNDDYDFVVRAEDDLLVSRDILQFFEFAAEEFEHDAEVASVHAYSQSEGDPFLIRKALGFNPLVWGTWVDRWDNYIGPTWDKDYSTNNGISGVNSGWDWNLNTRVLPRMGKQTVSISQSRVQNIGIVGTHGTPENFQQAPGWMPDYGFGEFRVE